MIDAFLTGFAWVFGGVVGLGCGALVVIFIWAIVSALVSVK